MIAQQLTAFVTGTVTDEGFEFEMPFPLVDGERAVTNFAGAAVTDLRDTRTGCIQPSLGGSWDQLGATKVTLSGSFLSVEGQRTVPSITFGIGEGDCATMSRTEAESIRTEGLQVGLPVALFTSEKPAAMPLVVTEGGWTFTYTFRP